MKEPNDQDAQTPHRWPSGICDPAMLYRRRNGMSGAYTRGMTGYENGNATAGVTSFLSLAAAPTLAIMALLTGALDAGQPALLCAGPQHASPLSGMVLMYVLMAAFHLVPWLKLVSGRRNASGQA
jgi:hypothetical protein